MHLGEGIAAMDHERLSVLEGQADLSDERLSPGPRGRRDCDRSRDRSPPPLRPPGSCPRSRLSGPAIDPLHEDGVRPWPPVDRGEDVANSMAAFELSASIPGHHQPVDIVGAGQEIFGRTTVELKVTVRVDPPPSVRSASLLYPAQRG